VKGDLGGTIVTIPYPKNQEREDNYWKSKKLPEIKSTPLLIPLITSPRTNAGNTTKGMDRDACDKNRRKNTHT